MVVLRAEVWPQGDATKARSLGIATLALVEVMPTGERAYDVRFWKAPTAGGLDVGCGELSADVVEAIISPRPTAIWRRGQVRGHWPLRLGVWDVIGGAAKVLLGDRLTDYRRRLVRDGGSQ